MIYMRFIECHKPKLEMPCNRLHTLHDEFPLLFNFSGCFVRQLERSPDKVWFLPRLQHEPDLPRRNVSARKPGWLWFHQRGKDQQCSRSTAQQMGRAMWC